MLIADDYAKQNQLYNIVRTPEGTHVVRVHEGPHTVQVQEGSDVVRIQGSDIVRVQKGSHAVQAHDSDSMLRVQENEAVERIVSSAQQTTSEQHSDVISNAQHTTSEQHSDSVATGHSQQEASAPVQLFVNHSQLKNIIATEAGANSDNVTSEVTSAAASALIDTPHTIVVLKGSEQVIVTSSQTCADESSVEVTSHVGDGDATSQRTEASVMKGESVAKDSSCDEAPA